MAATLLKKQQQKQQQDLAKEVFSPQMTKFKRKRFIHYTNMKHGQLIQLINHL